MYTEGKFLLVVLLKYFRSVYIRASFVHVQPVLQSLALTVLRRIVCVLFILFLTHFVFI